jgi:CYTH domain-containing protein
MQKKMEIERKFLIEIPELKKLNVVRELDIIQTYLNADNSELQRRVRKITENGNEKYVYTQKKFLSPTQRIEEECEISLQDYNKFLTEKKDNPPTIKKRICFDYHNQLFEMDIYSFSTEFAILELELDSVSQEIDFPECINVLKDVSADGRYSNAALAKENCFPEDAHKGVI